MPVSRKPDLPKKISSAITKLQKDLFAYLLVTSKSEGAMRDWLCFKLHERLQASGLTVAREYTTRGRKADVAILDSAGDKPVAIIEITTVGNAAKAVGSKRRRRPTGVWKVKADLEKWERKGVSRCFGLLVVSENRKEQSKKNKSNLRALKYLLKENAAKNLDGIYKAVVNLAEQHDLKRLCAGKTSSFCDNWFMTTSSLRWWLFARK